jgi:hypothetical protein
MDSSSFLGTLCIKWVKNLHIKIKENDFSSKLKVIICGILKKLMEN